MLPIKIIFKPTLNNLGNAFKSIDANALASEEINKVATGVVGFGKQLAPVDTGLMRSNIRQTVFSSPQSLRAMVETGVYYSIYVHEGTRYMRARPFLEEGAKFAVKDIASNISMRLEKGFADAFKRI